MSTSIFCLGWAIMIFFALLFIVAVRIINHWANKRNYTPPRSTKNTYDSSSSSDSYSSDNLSNYGSDRDEDVKESGGGLGGFIWDNIRPPDDLIDGSFLFPSSSKDDDEDDQNR